MSPVSANAENALDLQDMPPALAERVQRLARGEVLVIRDGQKTIAEVHRVGRRPDRVRDTALPKPLFEVSDEALFGPLPDDIQAAFEGRGP